nr:TPA: orf y [Tanacetum cinerariifolium]
MTRGRYQAARATRTVFGRNSYNTTLESAVDPERQLELSRERRANLVPAEALYSNNRIKLSNPKNFKTPTYLFRDIHDKVKCATSKKCCGEKILVIQEKLVQNQQDFLDEYLPQWDDQLSTRKQRSELEWENPFAAKRGYGKYHNSQWTLPPVWTESGVMLVLPADSGLYQWRAAYPGAYSALETITDDPQNITSQVRQLIIMEDPYRGSTDEQDRAYRDLDRITFEETKNFWSFLEDFWQSKQGNIASLAVYQKLDLDDNWDIVSADFDDSSIYSILEGECDVHQNINIMIQCTPFEEAAFMTIEEINESDDEQNIEEDYDSHHAFMFYPGPPTKIADMVQSTGRGSQTKNYQPKAKVVSMIGRNTRKQQHKPEEEKDFSSNDVRLLKELLKEKTDLLVRDLTNALKIIDQLKAEQMRLEEKKDEEIKKLKAQLQEKWDKEIKHATHRIKQGSFLIEGNKFKIPLIYAFDMRDNNGIEMLIGAKFLRSMKGGIRIEGDEITIYKKVARIKTSSQTKITEIAELEVSEEEFLETNESIYFNQEGSKAFLEQFKPVMDRLKQQGYIREEPLKHWKKNGELCKLDIINPNITIEDKPLKHVTPAMEYSFIKHVDSLLEIGDIRPSKSRHRTMAMIVNSGTTIDHVTGREIKGKEWMVFDYKSLNDNTYKDQYSLPGINTIIKTVGGAKVFSKFDLKSGFHQVSMDEESIPWTTFLVLGGLYEWLVMPFGLKNAPQEHAKHLEKMLKICEDNGLVLSPTKTKLAVSTIDFLGAIIGEGTIKLQPHIIKKIVNFNEEELKTKKGLRSFLGILNYARNHISKLGILLRPLYEKTNAHGDKRLKSSDYERMHGTIGRNSQMKKEQGRSKRFRKMCAYASGKFSTTQSTIDAEINACINTMEKLKIYYLDKQEELAAALHSVEEVLQSPNAFQKNTKTTCEEVIKISNHFQESSQRLSSHTKNQEHYINITISKPTKLQSE